MAQTSPEPADISRRNFLKRLGVAAGLLGGSGVAASLLHNRNLPGAGEGDAKGLLLPRFSVERPAGAPRLVIGRADRMDEAAVRRLLHGMLQKMGGLDGFVRKGDIVLLKPNVGFDRPPRMGATTSPEVVGAVVGLCREAGAERVLVVDNPINNPEGSFHKSRVGDAVARNGGEVVLPELRHFRSANLPAHSLGECEIFYEPLRLATKVINLPTAKDHNLCGASLSMKNWYGLLGKGRNRYHQGIDAVVAGLGTLFVPTLTILDATRLLMRNGPTGGSPNDVKPGNTLVAGTDPVAIDALGFDLLEKDSGTARYLEIAESRGLGTRDWRDLQPAEITL